MPSPDLPDTADVVVVGGGTVGAWCAYFLRRAGLDRVILVEKGLLGQGASSRAAGVVRMQGGTPEAVRLGIWSRRFYLRQRDEIGTDSGFTEPGLPAALLHRNGRGGGPGADGHAVRPRRAVRWLGPDEVDAANPTLAPGQTLGGTFCADDGYINPPRNVAAYTVALLHSGVRCCERVAFRGLRRAGGHRRDTSDGRITPGWSCSPAGRSWPRSAAWPGCGSRSAAPGTRSRSPSRTPTWTRPGCRWSSTWPPGCTGGPRRAACCSG